MRIINLHTENIKKIKAIDITPKGDTVVISGKNANGKSSALDSIAMVLGGKKLIPSKPIREGQTTAKIEVDLGEYKVTRNWTAPDKSYLKLENKDGANITNAQGILNRLVGELSFDPLEFSTMDPAKRFGILRRLTKVDFTELDKQYGEFYEQRTEVGRDGKSLNARLESEFKDLPDLPDKVDDIEEIKKQRDEANKNNERIQFAGQMRSRIERSLAAHKNSIIQAEHDIEGFRDQIIARQKELDQYRQKLSDEEQVLKGDEEQARKGLIEESQETAIDLSQFDEKIERYFDYKKAKETQERKAEVEQDRDHARKKWDELDAKIKGIDQSKIDMVAKADMPIKGLSFGDKEILFNNIPFAQLAMSEQIEVSVSISIAMNPRLRVAMIYNGSLLDEDAMESIAKIAKAKDIQIWIERVADKPDGNCIFIENGEVLQ